MESTTGLPEGFSVLSFFKKRAEDGRFQSVRYFSATSLKPGRAASIIFRLNGIGNSEVARFSKTPSGNGEDPFRLELLDKGEVIFDQGLWKEIEGAPEV